MVGILFVVLFGLSVNAYQTGGVASFDEAKDDVVHAVLTPTQPDWSKLND